MVTFIEVLEREMQSEEFIKILDEYFETSTQQEKNDIVRQILELVDQDSDIRQYSVYIRNDQDSLNQEEEFEEIAKLALEYVKKSIIESFDYFQNNEDDEDDTLFVNLHVLPTEEAEEPTEDDLGFRFELEDLTEFDMSDIQPEDEFDLDEQAQFATIDDIWSILAFRGMACALTKTAGAA